MTKPVRYVALVSGHAIRKIMEGLGIAGDTGQMQPMKTGEERMKETKRVKGWASQNQSEKDMSSVKASTSSSDMVNSPEHYASSNIECIDAMEAMVNQNRSYLTELDGHEQYCWQVIFKYVWRFPFKNNSVEDLKKARWYLNRLIERLERKK